MKKETKLEAIIFDMVGVLVFPINGYKIQTKQQKDANDIFNLYNFVDNEKLFKDIKEKLNLSSKDIDDAIQYIPLQFEEYETLWNLLPQLKQQYKIAVINNSNSIADKQWREEFNVDTFDVFIDSSEEKVKKPDAEIYQITLDRLKVKADKCLFMDSNKENVKQAERLGMNGIWWKNKEDGYTKFVNYLEEIAIEEQKKLFENQFVKPKQ